MLASIGVRHTKDATPTLPRGSAAATSSPQRFDLWSSRGTTASPSTAYVGYKRFRAGVPMSFTDVKDTTEVCNKPWVTEATVALFWRLTRSRARNV